MQFEEVLRTFVAYFDRESIPYALAGGLALVAWGHSRPTHDVDFVVSGSDAKRVVPFTESRSQDEKSRSRGLSI